MWLIDMLKYIFSYFWPTATEDKPDEGELSATQKQSKNADTRDRFDQIYIIDHTFSLHDRLVAERICTDKEEYPPSLPEYKGNLKWSLFLVVDHDNDKASGNLGHAMVYLLPAANVKHILYADEKLERGQEMVFGKKFSDIKVNEELEILKNDTGCIACICYHICLDDEKVRYILSREEHNTYKVWEKAGRDSVYFGNTELNLKGLNILALIILEKLNRRYILTKNDCLSYAKMFCRLVAKYENRNEQLEEVDRLLRELTVTLGIKSKSEQMSRKTFSGDVLGWSYGITLQKNANIR